MGKKESILKSTVKLNDLAIFVECHEKMSFDSIVNLLNELLGNGIYKRLQLICKSSKNDQNVINRMTSLHALEKLEIKIDRRNGFSVEHPLNSLKQLCVSGCDRIPDIQQFVGNLSNVEQIKFARIFISDLMQLVAQAPRLRRIICHWIQYRIFEREYIENYFIQLRKLNQQRKKLVAAKKVTLYVPEFILLRTRETQGKTDFEMIRIIRYESFEGENNLHIF